MKKAAIYIRVSTQEQAKEGYSIPAQRDKLIAFCKAKSLNIFDIYIDDGYTGTNMDRPALNKMLNNLEKIHVVLVYKLDRLSRSQRDVLYLVEEKFLSKNIDFVSVLESFDTSTPFGRAMLGILAVFAQLERETIIERTKLGKERRAKEGLWRGGGNIPIGYDFIDDQLVVNEYAAMKVREIFRLYSEGYGFNRIAVMLNKKGYKTTNNTKWSSSQVSRTLRNSTYAGLIEYNGEFYPGNHEPIIEKYLFDKVGDILVNNKSKNRSETNYLLQGMLWCGYCGARIKGSWSSKGAGGPRYYHYVCYSKVKRPLHMVKDPKCPSKSWKMEILDDMVVEQLMQLPLNRDRIIQKYEENKKPIKTYEDKFLLEEQISELDRQIRRLIDLYQDGKVPVNTISERIDKLYEEKKKIEENLKELNSCVAAETNHDISLDDILKLLGSFELIWAEATFEEKRIILRDFIKKIIVTDKPIIEWNNKNLN